MCPLRLNATDIFFFSLFFFHLVREGGGGKRWRKQLLRRVAEEKRVMRGQKQRDDREGAREMRRWIERGNKGAAWNKAYKAAVAAAAAEE